MTQQVDPFTQEILRSYLTSTVREMVVTTTRTAFSTVFAHGEDFTCAMFDADLRMVAQDQGVAAHAGGLEEALASIVDKVGTIEEGDVYLHNDPYDYGSHQADVMVCRPMFCNEEHVGFAVNRGHWTDVGGATPGGWSGNTIDVVQEGLLFSAITYMKAGTVNRDIHAILMRNVRVPDQMHGDLQAQIASNITAERRVRSLIERYGVEGWKTACSAAIAYSQTRMQSALEQIPDGTAEGEAFLEDDGRGRGPFVIRVRLTKSSEGFTADFRGTDRQSEAPINGTLATTLAAVNSSVLAVADPGTPLNSGVTKYVHVIAEEGTLVRPMDPAPTFSATADPVSRTAEAVLDAFRKLCPDRVPASHYWTGNNVTGTGTTESGKRFIWYSYQAGGCGAKFSGDGNSGEWHLLANSKNESMEVWERRQPVEFLGYSLVPDSGGAGKFRGGLGTERRMRVTAATSLSGISDHHVHGAAGAESGKDGQPNAFALVRSGERRSLQEVFGLTSPSKFGDVPLAVGDVFVTLQGGGGGYGPPDERDEELIDYDVEHGYVSAEAAERDYGWDARE